MYKSVVKEKIKIIMICVHTQMYTITTKDYGIEYAGRMSKSIQPVRSYSTSDTLFLCSFNKCQNIATLSSTLLVH